METFVRLLILTAVVVTAIFLSGCGSTPDLVQPPPPEVTVSLPVKKEVTVYLEFTGTMAPLESVEVRARVQGFLEKILFTPMAKVKAGDLLFVIDPRPFKAKVDQADGVLKSKEAALELAKTKFDRTSGLYASSSVSEIQYLEDKAKRDMAVAEVTMAKADLEAAQLDLDFTQVKAPITGRTSRNLVDVGNLVGASEKTLLTSLVNDDSIYAYFNISENDLLRIMRKYGSGKQENAEEQKPVPAYLALADEQDFPHKGALDFVDNQVDPGTGTLKARAVFANSDGILVAGLFARVRVPLETREALLVPNQAVGLDQSGRYVLVAGKDNVVEQRPVQIGSLVERMRVIEKGLSESDLVIIAGIQRARPGARVTPMKASEGSSEPGAPAGAPKPKD